MSSVFHNNHRAHTQAHTDYQLAVDSTAWYCTLLNRLYLDCIGDATGLSIDQSRIVRPHNDDTGQGEPLADAEEKSVPSHSDTVEGRRDTP